MSTLLSKAYGKLPKCEREKLHESMKTFVALSKLSEEIQMMNNENKMKYEIKLGNEIVAYNGMGQQVEGKVIRANINHHNNARKERFVVTLKNYRLIDVNDGISTEERGKEEEFDLTNWTIVN